MSWLSRLHPTRRMVVVGVAIAMVAAALPTVSAGAADPDDSTSSCTSSGPLLVQDGFTLPAWADGGGWINPDQYETIAAGDLDGDGRAELVGRNASHVEIFTWDTAYGSTGGSKAYDPTPGQWRHVVPATGATLQPFATVDGWWDPSTYSTFQLADLDGDHSDELLARLTEGLAVYRYDTSARTWAAPWQTTAFSDAAGWGQGSPWAYETISTGNVDGRPGDEVVALGADGIEVWSDTGGNLTRVTTTALLDDPAVWQLPQHYSTLRLADVDRDGRDELLARGPYGMLTYRFEPSTGSWTQRETLAAWSDAEGWDGEEAYSAIATADIDGDGAEDLVGRSIAGLEAWRFVDGPDDGTWELMAPAAGFSDAEGWRGAANRSTVQPADVLPSPGVEMIGRAEGGVITYDWAPPASGEGEGSWFLAPGEISAFSDDAGFGSIDAPGGGVPASYRYATIQPVRVESDQPELVIGRGATGILTRRADGSSPSASFPAYTDLANPPPASDPVLVDLGSTEDDLWRAFRYVNSTAVSTYFEGRGTGLLDEFAFASNGVVWPAMIGELTASQNAGSGNGGSDGVFDPGDERFQAMNVSRATYNQVLQDVHDWTSSVSTVNTQMLGEEGMKQFLQEGFIDQLGTVADIASNFEGNEELYAFFADLVWGLIGALGALAAFLDPAVAAAEIAAIVASASIASASVAGAMGFYNPNGAADAEAANLESTIRETLCTANRFIDESFEQIVGDYGLLTTTGRALFDTRMTSAGFNRAVTAANASSALWVWQQFGDAKPAVGVSNMWVGWCGPTDTTCKFDESGSPDTIWTAPEGGIRYRLIGELPGSEGTDGNCEFDVLANTPGLDGLKPDPKAFSAPRHTVGDLAGQPFVSENTGVNGWNLGNKWCGTL